MELRKSPPWQTYYRKVYALFDSDPEVAVMFNDGEEKVLTLYVDNTIKAEAIETLLPAEVNFGNVLMTVEVVPSNTSMTPEQLFRHAFSGNHILSDVESVEGVLTNPICYVLFQPSIIQFWDDDLSDANGVCTMLPQDVAKDVFDEQQGVFFCTDLIDGITVE